MLETIILRLRLWSFIVLPVAGFVIGQILQIVLGTRHNPKFEAIFVHLVTVTLMIILFADVSTNNEKIVDVRDRNLFLSISYLFILGTIIGILSNIF